MTSAYQGGAHHIGNTDRSFDGIDKSSLADRRKYPKEKDGLKNEWKAVGTHLGEINETINKVDHDIKNVKAQELQMSYENRMQAENMRREHERIMKEKEAELMKLKAKIEEEELARIRMSKNLMQQNLAQNYDSMVDLRRRNELNKKEKDMLDGTKMIDQAKKSLEIEQDMNKRKQDVFKQEAKAQEELAELKRKLNREMADLERDQYLNQLKRNAQVDDLRETNYRNYFRQFADNQNILQDIHTRHVVQPEREKFRQREEFIAKAEEEIKRKNEELENLRAMKHKALADSTANGLRNQIFRHNEDRDREKFQYRQEVEDRMRKTFEYQEWMEANKKEAKDQKKFYKEALDKQVESMEKAKHMMNRNEKDLNIKTLHAYKEYDKHVTALIPGYTNSKYIHPYSPEARYAHLVQHKEIGNTRIMPSAAVPNRNEHNEMNSGPDTIFYQPSPPALDNRAGATLSNAVNNSMDRIIPPKLHSLDDINRAYNVNGRSSPFVSPMARNPILNPIPNSMANPYLMKEIMRMQQQNLKQSVDQDETSKGYSPSYLASVGNKNLRLN